MEFAEPSYKSIFQYIDQTTLTDYAGIHIIILLLLLADKDISTLLKYWQNDKTLSNNRLYSSDFTNINYYTNNNKWI